MPLFKRSGIPSTPDTTMPQVDQTYKVGNGTVTLKNTQVDITISIIAPDADSAWNLQQRIRSELGTNPVYASDRREPDPKGRPITSTLGYSASANMLDHAQRALVRMGEQTAVASSFEASAPADIKTDHAQDAAHAVETTVVTR